MPPTRRPNPQRPANPAEAVRDIKAGLNAITDRLEQVFGGAGAASSTGNGTDGLSFGTGPLEGVFGFSVRMGAAGVETQTFGNLKPGPDGTEMADAREPLVDLIEDGATVTVTVELPGADADRIETTLDGETLRVAAEGGRRYATDIELGGPVDEASLSRNYQNGILEIRLTRSDA